MTRKIDDVLGSRKARGSRTPHPSKSGGQSQRRTLRTVVKARYRTLGSQGKNPGLGRASAVMRNMDYFTTRPDHQHQHRISRDLITPEGRINLQSHPEARQQLIDELAQNNSKYIYHLVLSSGDSSMNEWDTEQWARAVLNAQGIGRYYLGIHAGERGHTEHPHAHVVLMTDVRLERSDFYDLRQSGDQEQQFHRRLQHSLEEVWKERVTDHPTSSGGGQREVEDAEPQAPKRKDIDIQFH